ncbi:aminoacyl-tRNA hydrolase [bacterium]|nr:aminoacyl-tRNA hydrolase [bacterium]
MKLIVGLGNPGLKYKNTRHNVGFMVLNAFAEQNNYKFKNKREFKGEIYIDKNFILLKPDTFMNLSGDSVRKVVNFYKIDPSDILVICDDFNIPFLKLRLRMKGSSGGHNGLKSIIQNIGSEDFPRLRIGLGEPDENDIVDYVLSKFSKADLDKFKSLYSKTNDLIDEFILDRSIDLIMNRYNTNESL